MLSKLKRVIASAILVWMLAVTVIIAYAADDTVQLVTTEEKETVAEEATTVPEVIVIELEEPEKKEEATPSVITPSNITIKYARENVFVRNFPSVYGNTPVGEYMKGDAVAVISCESGWAKVWYAQQELYMAERFLVDTKEEAMAFINEYTDVFNAMSDEDYDIMTKCVYLEALGEPMESKMAVVEVILNRIASPIWPNNATDVIYQRGQFSTAKSIKNVQEGSSYKPYGVSCVDLSECRQAIENVRQKGRTILPYNYVYFATYHANGWSPIKIGHHYYCAGKVGY